VLPPPTLRQRASSGGVSFRPLRTIDGSAAAGHQAQTATETHKCLIPSWFQLPDGPRERLETEGANPSRARVCQA
jgi:hypothetical protein